MPHQIEFQKTFSVERKKYTYYSLEEVSKFVGDVSRLPYSLKILLENILRLQDKMVRAMPHIVRNRNKQNGKLLAVKEIKDVFGLSLYDSKMLMELCWAEPDPHTLTIIEPMQKHFDVLVWPANITPKSLPNCKYAFEYDADFHIFLNENGVLAMPLQKF